MSRGCDCQKYGRLCFGNRQVVLWVKVHHGIKHWTHGNNNTQLHQERNGCDGHGDNNVCVAQSKRMYSHKCLAPMSAMSHTHGVAPVVASSPSTPKYRPVPFQLSSAAQHEKMTLSPGHTPLVHDRVKVVPQIARVGLYERELRVIFPHFLVALNINPIPTPGSPSQPQYT